MLLNNIFRLSCKKPVFLHLIKQMQKFEIPTETLTWVWPCLFSHDYIKERKNDLKLQFDLYCTSLFTCMSKQVGESLLEVRDLMEDFWSQLNKEFHTNCALKGLDEYLKSFKKRTTLDMVKPADFCKSQWSIIWTESSNEWPHGLRSIVLNNEIEMYIEAIKQVVKYYPALKASRDQIELATTQLESTDCLDLQKADFYKQTLNLKSYLPVLVLWKLSKEGWADELFANCPLPRVFGSPCSVRNHFDVNKPETLFRPSTSRHLNALKLVLAGQGHLGIAGYKKTTGDLYDTIHVLKVEEAHLICNLPGLSDTIWLVNPQSLKSCICKVRPEFKKIVEFDLPSLDAVKKPNWVDSQRDSEGNLVLHWGHIHELTGTLKYESMIALDEDSLTSLNFLDSVAAIPKRRTKGLRIDYRDHGNVLGIYHKVVDKFDAAGTRKWSHTYDILFAETSILTYETESRPIEAVYGSPQEFFVLCPMSKIQLQHWVLNNKSSSCYELQDKHEVPKLVEGTWSSLCIAS